MLTIDPPPTPAIDADGLNAIGFHLLSEFEWACSVIGAVPIDVRGPNRTPKLKAYRQAITKWLRVPRFHGTLTFSYPEIATVMRAKKRGTTGHSSVVEWAADCDSNPDAVAHYAQILGADYNRVKATEAMRLERTKRTKGDKPTMPPPEDRLTTQEVKNLEARYMGSPMMTASNLGPRELGRLINTVAWGVAR